MMTPTDIRELRDALGLTAAKFGELVGVSENTVNRWEMGDRHPNYKRLQKLNDLAKTVPVSTE